MPLTGLELVCPEFVSPKRVQRRLGRRRIAKNEFLDLGQFAHLGETEVVTRRVAESRVDSVGPLFGLLDEVDAASLQLLVRSLDIVGGEERSEERRVGKECRSRWSQCS